MKTTLLALSLALPAGAPALACSAGEILPKPAAPQGRPVVQVDEPCRLHDAMLAGPAVIR